MSQLRIDYKEKVIPLLMEQFKYKNIPNKGQFCKDFLK